jgi:hypothetical protein
MPEYTKADILDALLDTHRLCMDLFDAVEAEYLVINQPLLIKMNQLIGRLDAAYRSFVQEYALSGRAADDFLANVRAELRRDSPGQW